VIATTESPLDTLEHHAAIMADNASGGWGGRVVTAYRPDPVVDPEFEGFRDNLKRFPKSPARIA
jgi:glucuronate isomerase